MPLLVARPRGLPSPCSAGAEILLSPLTPAGDLTGPTFYSPLYSSPSGVQERHDVNAWMRRVSGAYNSSFDFDPVIKDPQSPDHIRQSYNSGDNLHPNLAGQQVMAGSIECLVGPQARTASGWPRSCAPRSSTR